MRPDKKERVRFYVDCRGDSAFAACCRLLQSKWRERKGYPKGEYGNFLNGDFAINSKANFLTDNIKQLVADKIISVRKQGGVIREPRIWDNLLSSQPLCFNLFGEQYYDLELATAYFRALFPGKVDKVTAIDFEYSPGRGDYKYTGDKSAFDVFVEYTTDNKKGFIGIEVKYSESLREESIKDAERHFRERYVYWTENCGLFKPNSISRLKYPPLSQIWRDHLLSIATKQDYDEGFFVFLYPTKNKQCQAGVDEYQEHLLSTNEEETGFYPRYLEDYIGVLHQITNSNWSQELIERYIGERR